MKFQLTVNNEFEAALMASVYLYFSSHFGLLNRKKKSKCLSSGLSWFYISNKLEAVLDDTLKFVGNFYFGANYYYYFALLSSIF